jgi:hypothetical protein
MNPIKIQMSELLEYPFLISCSDGEFVGRILANLLENNLKVCLNFMGAESVSTAFLGSLMDILLDADFSQEYIINNIEIEGDEEDRMSRKFIFFRTLEEVVDYRRRPEFHKKIMRELMEEWD